MQAGPWRHHSYLVKLNMFHSLQFYSALVEFVCVVMLYTITNWKLSTFRNHPQVTSKKPVIQVD